ncbi:MAG: SusC/RagA family TonB-linked outer membrane protein [Bacteroidales bacterium]|nr:SusC/RagA family TonB-linked outer membrane protein [Bacteroidales bacterium]
MLKKLLCLTGTLAVLLAFLCGVTVSAQNKTVRGTVVDAQGAPVVGAAIVVVGNTSIGAVTGADGSFRLNVPAGSSVEVSCIGYATQVIPVADKTVIDVILREDTEFLEETVVIGYGVQRKSDLTGSVASVRSEELMDRSTSDAAAALQGKAAGVQVFNDTGAPGEGSSIRVRGISSNSGSGLGPLLIVDGLKVDKIDYLDPSMIESMEVLKDAASAAIYGAQAGNGVVLITTKNGSKSRDGRIFYNYKLTMTQLGHHAQVMNARQYIDWQQQAGNLPSTEDLIKTGVWDGETDTNWADVLYGTGITQSHTFGAQGGNDRGSYFVSLNYLDEDGMARGSTDTYTRFTAQVNADYKIKSWFTVGTNTSVERRKQQKIGEHSEYAGGSAGLLGTLVIDPLTPVYFKSYDELSQHMKDAVDAGFQKVYGPEDHPGWYYAISKILEGDGINPLIYRDRNQKKEEGWQIRGTVYANITPFKGLVFTSRLGYRIKQKYESNFEEPYYANAKSYSQVYSISATSSQDYYYQWENFANYNVNLGKHALGAMAGMSWTYSDSRGVGAGLTGEDPLKGYAENFRYLTQDNGSGTKSISGGSPSQSAQLSYFGRLTYSYDNRYSLQTNFRADAFDSSKLSPKNRWGYFPSVSAGWTASNEPFIKDNISREFLSFLKFRGSWGINGNIAVLSGYPYSTSISYNSQSYQFGEDNTLSLGSKPDGLANPDLTWETSVQTDFGMDLRLFNNRFSLGVDWYNKDTRDLLVSISPVAEVGISRTTVNAGSVNNTGWEFELGWQDNIGDFHYSINGNLSTLKNKVTYLEPSVGHQSGSSFGNMKFSTWFEKDYPVWFFRGYQYAGIGEDGKALYYTAPDKDGVVGTTNAPVDADMGYMGSALPPVNYGVTIHMDWKGLDFTLFGTGAAGHQLMPCVYRVDHSQINSLVYFYEECGKSLPKIENIWNSKEFWSSSAVVFPGDFFKIKQIQLGYTLPMKWTRKIMIENLRFYVSMDDWFVFTKYPGFDPETASTGSSTGMGLDKGSYPNAKKLLFGVNVSF